MKRAFTLVEIMVVVAIIALLAGLAIPMMLRNRINTNEAIAITSCRNIGSACQSYYAITLPHTYPPDLQTLGSASTPAYIDDALASGEKSGYNFIYQRTTVVSFTLYAEPLYEGKTGKRYFYTDETGRITAKEGGRAGPNDPAV